MVFPRIYILDAKQQPCIKETSKAKLCESTSVCEVVKLESDLSMSKKKIKKKRIKRKKDRREYSYNEIDSSLNVYKNQQSSGLQRKLYVQHIPVQLWKVTNL